MEVRTTEQVNEWLWRYGYPWAPSVLAIEDLVGHHMGPLYPDGEEVACNETVRTLSVNHPARIEMLKLAQTKMLEVYQHAGMMLNTRIPVVDGMDGPVTFEMCSTERCGLPDYVPLRLESELAFDVGTGPWKRCHDVGEFHAAHIRFTNSPPSHLKQEHSNGKTVFQEALKRTRESYREIGLLLYFSGPDVGDDFLPKDKNMVQSNASFVGSSSGWIGLAIVGNNGMSCSGSPIWARFLQGFASSSSAEAKAHAWHLLFAHEFGHNCGLGHTSGGIMNPSLNTRASGKWIGDTAEGWMKGRFGGEAVPVPGPDPEPPPDPELSWWQRMIKLFFGV